MFGETPECYFFHRSSLYERKERRSDETDTQIGHHHENHCCLHASETNQTWTFVTGTCPSAEYVGLRKHRAEHTTVQEHIEVTGFDTHWQCRHHGARETPGRTEAEEKKMGVWYPYNFLTSELVLVLWSSMQIAKCEGGDQFVWSEACRRSLCLPSEWQVRLAIQSQHKLMFVATPSFSERPVQMLTTLKGKEGCLRLMRPFHPT